MLKLTLEHLYMLGTCFCPLKCVRRSHMFALNNSKLFAKFSVMLLQFRHKNIVFGV
jgi:hypothetical protein